MIAKQASPGFRRAAPKSGYGRSPYFAWVTAREAVFVPRLIAAAHPSPDAVAGTPSRPALSHQERARYTVPCPLTIAIATPANAVPPDVVPARRFATGRNRGPAAGGRRAASARSTGRCRAGVCRDSPTPPRAVRCAAAFGSIEGPTGQLRGRGGPHFPRIKDQSAVGPRTVESRTCAGLPESA